jgi:hypothetical protein
VISERDGGLAGIAGIGTPALLTGGAKAMMDDLQVGMTRETTKAVSLV